MNGTVMSILIGVIALVIGILAGYIIRKTIGEKTIGDAETKARNIILDAENRSETIKKEIALEAKEEALKYKNEAEKEIKERRNEVTKSENRLLQKDMLLASFLIYHDCTMTNLRKLSVHQTLFRCGNSSPALTICFASIQRFQAFRYR